MVSLLENEIRQQIKSCFAFLTTDRKRAEECLKKAYQYIIENAQEGRIIVGRSQKQTIAPDVYVVCAEAAVQIQHFDIAKECLHTFFLTSPPSNEFLCRAYYAQALVEENVAVINTMKGKELANQIRISLDKLIKGIKLAQANSKRFAYLIHDGAVMYWNIARIMFRDGARKNVVDTLEIVSQALREIDDSLEWRIRFLLQLSFCYDEVARVDDAIKAITEASDLLTKMSTAGSSVTSAFSTEITKTKLYIARKQPAFLTKLRGELQNNPTGKALMLIQLVKEGVTVDPQQIFNDLNEAYRLAGIKQAAAPPTNETKKAKEKPARADSAGTKKDLSDEQYYIIGELGLACTMVLQALQQPQQQQQMLDIASECADRAAQAKSLRPRVKSEYIQAEIAVKKLGPHQEKLTQDMVATRVQSLKRLEKALESALRLGEGDVVEEGCILIWELVLPILQPNLRKYVRKPLQTASKALEDIDSKLHHLRTSLYLEIANCDIHDDLLTKAADQVDKGLSLDYVVSEEEANLFGMIRPLDRHLLPIKEKLDLKINIYKDPETPEDEALLLIEQAKESTDVRLRTSQLQRAVALLAQSAAGDIPNALDEEQLKRRRANLLSEIVKTAWKDNHHIINVVRSAGPILLEQEFNVERDKELVINQALTSYILAESYIVQLAEEYLELGEEVDETDAEGKSIVTQAEESILKYIQTGVDFGLKLGQQQDWVVLNGAIYLWNYYLHLYKQNKFFSSLPALEKSFNALKSLSRKDNTLLWRIAFAYANALIQRMVKQKQPLLPASALAAITTSHELFQNATPNCAELKTAEEVCTYVIPLMKPMQVKELIFLLARIEKLNGKQPTVKGEPTVQVLSIIEILSQPGDANTKLKLLSDGLEQLKQAPNPELCARLAEQALALKQSKLVLEISKLSNTLVPAQPDEDDTSNAAVTEKGWRWFSLTTLYSGQAIASMVDPNNQNKKTQDDLRMEALQRFVVAAKYGKNANSEALCLCAAHNFLKVCSPFMKTDYLRKYLAHPLQQLLVRECAKVKPVAKQDVDTMERLYTYLFSCKRDQRQFDEGLELVKKALQQLPRNRHKVPWEIDIEFRSRAGKDAFASVNRVKEYDQDTQAKVWHTLGRFSQAPKDKLLAYQNAIQILAEKPLKQVPYMIEFAVWLFLNNHPLQDAIDYLMTASDILNEMDYVEDEDDVPDEGQSAVTGRSNRTRRSGTSSRPSGKASSSKTKNSKASMARSKKTGSIKSKAQSSRESRKSAKKAKTASQDEDEDTNQDDGDQSLDCHLLEMMARINILLSVMSATTQQKVDYALLAHYYIIRIWKTAYETANAKAAAKQTQQQPPTGDAGSAASLQYVLPMDLHEWINFSVPQDLREFFKSDPSKRSINTHSFPAPHQLFYFADRLNDILIDHGFYLHALPVLSLIDFISEDIAEDPNLTTLVRLRMASLLERINMSTESNNLLKRLKADGMLELKESVQRVHLEEVKQKQQIDEIVAQQFSSASRVFFEQKPLGRVTTARPIRSRDSFNDTLFKERLIDEIPIREVWANQAKCLINGGIGSLSLAKTLLQEALLHAETFADYEVCAQCYHLSAQLAFLEGKRIPTSVLELEARAHESENTLQFFRESLVLEVRSLLSTQEISDARQAEAVINNARTVFSDLVRTKSNATMDASKQLALLEGEFAQCILDEYIKTDGTFNGSPLSELRTALILLQSSCERLSYCDDAASLCVALRKYASALLLEKATDTQCYKNQLTDVLKILNRAKDLAEKVVLEVVPSATPGTICLPASANLAEILLLAGQTEIMLSRVERELMGPSMERPKSISRYPHVDGMDHSVIDEYMAKIASETNPPPPPDEMTREDKALSYFTSALNICSIPRIETSSRFNVGRCLRLLAQQKGQLSSDIWTASVTDANEKVELSVQVGCALEYLYKSLEMASDLEEWDIMAQVSLEIAKCFGVKSDVSAAYIALAQSASCSSAMLSLFESACASDNREMVFLRLRNHLRSILTQPQQSESYQKLYALLSSNDITSARFAAWSKISLTIDIADALKMIPDNTAVIVIHPSPSKNHLYGALLSGTLSTAAAPAGQAGATQVDPVTDNQLIRRAARAPFDIDKFTRLTQSLASWTDSIGNAILRGARPQSDEFSRLDEVFYETVLKGTEELMAPLLSQFAKELSSPGIRNVVITLDASLAPLPLELMEMFKNVQSVTRDFSLHFFLSRLAAAKANNPIAIAPNWSNLTYVIDPLLEDASRKENSLANSFEKLRKTLSASKMTPQTNWQGIVGTDHKPNDGEYQRLMSAASVFLFNGFGSILGQVTPQNISALDLKGLDVALVFDRAQNAASYRRESKDRMSKTPRMKNLEMSPFATAALLSLRGAKTVVLNQWPAVEDTNMHIMSKLCERILLPLTPPTTAPGAAATAERISELVHGSLHKLAHKTSIEQQQQQALQQQQQQQTSTTAKQQPPLQQQQQQQSQTIMAQLQLFSSTITSPSVFANVVVYGLPSM